MSERIAERSRCHPPVVGICGRSGSGKTLLIERLVPLLITRGLRVAVVKHCTHRIDSDRPGKDSDRIFQAGADVLAAGPGESFARFHAEHMPLDECVRRIADRCDLALVEGCRDAATPKIWVGPEPDEAYDAPGEILLFLRDAAQGCADAEQVVWQVVEQAHAALPVLAAVLVGVRRALLERVVAAVAEHAAEVLLAGSGEAPGALKGLRRLPDVPGVEGPMAGAISAMRWRPDARWLVLARDLPLLTTDAVCWLLKQGRPGLDAVMPAVPDDHACESALALYEPTARWFVELAAARGEFSLRRALDPGRVFRPRPPAALQRAWANANTLDE